MSCVGDRIIEAAAGVDLDSMPSQDWALARNGLQAMKFAGIEYHGSEGTTQSCLQAIARLYEGPGMLAQVRLLSAEGQHAFLVSFESGRLVGIRAGFRSGYPGEGPRGLATALRFFDRIGVQITEHSVPHPVIRRLNASALTSADMERISSERSVPGERWRDYTYHFDLDHHQRDAEFRGQFPHEVPIRIVDLRILDLALDLPMDADAALMSGYRRLEEILRKRSGIEKDHGVNFLRKVFQGKNSLLHWPGTSESEGDGRATLFIAVFQAFRNSRAHKELDLNPDESLREFLLLNELFRLESVARPRLTDSGAQSA